MNVLQARLVIMALEFEIKTWDTSRMTISREPALKTLERLTGVDVKANFGTGLKARQKALEWLQECMAMPENQHENY